jgi:GNAT superfamily N-acetyltransferase
MNITVSRNNNPAYERQFDELIKEVFCFSFAPWFDRKLWDERYESYSIIQDGTMLSNVCICKTDMLIRGQTIRAHQFGAVATRESERGKGLSRLLMDYILSLYPDVPAFLYANPSVIDFYPRFGFRQAPALLPGIVVTINNTLGRAIKYSPDDELIIHMLGGRRIYSSIADSVNTQPVQIFHLLTDYRDDIYYLPKCGAMIVAEQELGRLFLADVVTPEPISFDELKKELPFSGVAYVEFGFCPDWLGVDPQWERADAGKEPFFLRGNWDLPEAYRFPAMSAT